ncbi:P-loop containing nucleoside triphosphate hydrolase protein [Rhizopogon vinicolor AM-OR11-026]|uniref:p-loop containing nucleoside triphosphate hydrolase protein n=1 Tax=Rhizopogon vinicolor AM-OR11-026 TaxID=1314800 RepID=A0A1B7MVM0_9AGAM|nr:P-loop containing nucleoside triphosphate hydrolase protein [Rhizopogon vinicolor AM-OR11-026]
MLSRKTASQHSAFSPNPLNAVMNMSTYTYGVPTNSSGEEVDESTRDHALTCDKETECNTKVEGSVRTMLSSSPSKDSGHDSTASPPVNIIVFGESGVGKSSIINMLMGEPVAAVSNQAVGCTYESTKFRSTIAGKEVILFDTAGLNEAEAGTVSPEQAIENLRSLVTELKTVNLLVYCIRGTRFRKIVADNYKMFCNTICGSDRKVPVVLVVTGLENEENMDHWWEYNKVDFGEMEFRGHACITATRGRAYTYRDASGYIFQDLYDASREKVMRLLEDYAFESSITIVPPRGAPTSVQRASNNSWSGPSLYHRFLNVFLELLGLKTAPSSTTSGAWNGEDTWFEI